MSTRIEGFDASMTSFQILERGDLIVEDVEDSAIVGEFALVISGDEVAVVEGSYERLAWLLEDAVEGLDQHRLKAKS